MKVLCPENFSEYELLDCGGFEKLERFGDFITIRPEPQAVWPSVWGKGEWEKKAHVKFIPKSSSSGTWKKLKQMPDQWTMSYRFTSGEQITFRLGLTSFKHVGVFPEQAVNWDSIHEFFSAPRLNNKRFLNLFAYTGGASLAARAAGAEVTHVDSIRQVVSWANENMQKSGLDNIRWMVDDAMKFVKKEQRRGNVYQGIILDPPAYGHGPNGEKWKLEENVAELIQHVLGILDTKEHLLILNAYSLGFSALVPENLLRPFAVQQHSDLQIGELFLPSRSGTKLPLGVWGKLCK
jgi:23S rRNA (cytosine1962-C5)-methyltransferase